MITNDHFVCEIKYDASIWIVSLDVSKLAKYNSSLSIPLGLVDEKNDLATISHRRRRWRRRRGRDRKDHHVDRVNPFELKIRIHWFVEGVGGTEGHSKNQDVNGDRAEFGISQCRMGDHFRYANLLVAAFARRFRRRLEHDTFRNCSLR